MNISIPLITLVSSITPNQATMPTENVELQRQLISKEELVQIVSEKQKLNLSLDQFVLVIPSIDFYKDQNITVAKKGGTIQKEQAKVSANSVISNTEE